MATSDNKDRYSVIDGMMALLREDGERVKWLLGHGSKRLFMHGGQFIKIVNFLAHELSRSCPAKVLLRIAKYEILLLCQQKTAKKITIDRVGSRTRQVHQYRGSGLQFDVKLKRVMIAQPN